MRLERLSGGRHVAMPCDDVHRKPGWMARQRRLHVESRHSRHADVHDDTAAPMRHQRPEEILGTREHGRCVSAQAQEQREGIANRCVVVDDEDRLVVGRAIHAPGHRWED
jgi:hypothetical protein